MPFDNPVLSSTDDSPYEPQEYGSIKSLPEEIQSYCEKIHDDLTIQQLRELSDYFSVKANKLREAAEKNVTIADFEKAKKADIDEDGEQGEE